MLLFFVGLLLTVMFLSELQSPWQEGYLAFAPAGTISQGAIDSLRSFLGKSEGETITKRDVDRMIARHNNLSSRFTLLKKKFRALKAQMERLSLPKMARKSAQIDVINDQIADGNIIAFPAPIESVSAKEVLQSINQAIKEDDTLAHESGRLLKVFLGWARSRCVASIEC
jgi:hypothetical protein